MQRTEKTSAEEVHPFWGSSFMRGIPREVDKLNESLGLELEYTVNQPKNVDGDPKRALQVVFMIIKRPWFLKESYCLYVIYERGILRGFIGRLNNNEIKTLRRLEDMEDIGEGFPILHRWIQSLIKTSCDKI